VLDSASFYETLFEKVPLDELEENWFIEKIIAKKITYDTLKKTVDLVLGIFLFIVLIPFMILSAILIKITSRGPAIFTQKRMGKNEEPFVLYKFRTMKNEENGPLWTTDGDKRVTLIGKFLRRTHLDEFPQLYNIIKGDISFIGPRAERMELAKYYSKLPRYEIRHIIKPGLTGWAQLNYKPSASLEEAKEKLQYDVYYIKNRSLILDFLILLKTVKYLFVSNGKS
jgi:lipopolysaccharide/colanic/teichoic acid biosynthesis glycosyltransferase